MAVPATVATVTTVITHQMLLKKVPRSTDNAANDARKSARTIAPTLVGPCSMEADPLRRIPLTTATIAAIASKISAM